MTHYHYCVLGKSEAAHSVESAAAIDMENVDYKRQPQLETIAAGISAREGLCCGILRGGMFGLATNQVAVLSAWHSENTDGGAVAALAQQNGWGISEQERMTATVRPLKAAAITRPGIYVIRWIRMLTSDIDEYTRLCVETWPRFEATTRSRCFGVFRPLETDAVSKLLMLTWYASLDDWESSRQLDPADKAKWGRRSEMELSHWAQAGRLA